jgi:rod shape-determining protein MreC
MKLFDQKQSKTIITIGLLIVGFLFLDATLLGKRLQSGLLSATRPFLQAGYSAGQVVGSWFRPPTDTIVLEQQNAELRDNILALQQQVVSLQEAQIENEALRQLLDFYEDDSSNLSKTISRVIGRDPENSAILLLNVGERDGVQEGNAVIMDDGIIVAKIIEVYTKSSRALLLNDSASSLAVTVSGSSPSSKIAQGERGLGLILDQIPQGEILTQGQIVITSGLEPTIPKGLIVGEIEETISETNDLFQSAILRPLINYNEINFVSVILSS